MYTVIIKNAEIEPLLTFLNSEYNNVLEKVWECADITNTVFVGTEWSWNMIEHTITVVIQYHTDRRECEMTMVASGNARASPIGMRARGLEKNTESKFTEMIENLADHHGWEIEGRTPTLGLSKCPYCGTYYSYKKTQVLEDGSVKCQNCNRNFLLTVAQESNAPEG